MKCSKEMMLLYAVTDRMWTGKQTLMEQVEDALLYLESAGISLDVSELPKVGAKGQAALRLRREEELVKAGTLRENLEENDYHCRRCNPPLARSGIRGTSQKSRCFCLCHL